MRFGEKLRLIRNQSGRSARDAAGAAGTSESYWYNVEGENPGSEPTWSKGWRMILAAGGRPEDFAPDILERS